MFRSILSNRSRAELEISIKAAMTILTFLYNSLLICFIAVHLLVGGALTFGAGMYAGIYISQNYEIPRVDEPGQYWEKFKTYLEQHKKTDK